MIWSGSTIMVPAFGARGVGWEVEHGVGAAGAEVAASAELGAQCAGRKEEREPRCRVDERVHGKAGPYWKVGQGADVGGLDIRRRRHDPSVHLKAESGSPDWLCLIPQGPEGKACRVIASGKSSGRAIGDDGVECAPSTPPFVGLVLINAAGGGRLDAMDEWDVASYRRFHEFPRPPRCAARFVHGDRIEVAPRTTLRVQQVCSMPAALGKECSEQPTDDDGGRQTEREGEGSTCEDAAVRNHFDTSVAPHSGHSAAGGRFTSGYPHCGHRLRRRRR